MILINCCTDTLDTFQTNSCYRCDQIVRILDSCFYFFTFENTHTHTHTLPILYICVSDCVLAECLSVHSSPNGYFISLSLSAKGGEGSSPMPKCRVPQMVCCGLVGWAGLMTWLTHLSGHVFVSPLSMSLSCPRHYGWAGQYQKVDSKPGPALKSQWFYPGFETPEEYLNLWPFNDKQ